MESSDWPLDQASTAIGRSLHRFELKTKVEKLIRRMATDA